MRRAASRYSRGITGFRERSFALAVVLPLLAGAGCGGEDRVDSPQAETPSPTETGAATEPAGPPETETTETTGESEERGAANLAARPPGTEGLRVAAKRARIVARASSFGDVLFDANGQVVYAFEIDGPNRSKCTSEECVKAWPPVLTRQEPSAGAGIKGRPARDDSPGRRAAAGHVQGAAALLLRARGARRDQVSQRQSERRPLVGGHAAR
jgi:predicted lipoprotein with Yx(FWY)xxD motif